MTVSNKIKPKFLDRLDKYTEHLGDLREVYYRENYDDDQITPPVNVTMGLKYAKVIAGSFTHSFINMENGDIHRTGSESKPRSVKAGGVRGNIFEDDWGMSCVGPYGALSSKKKKAWPFTRRGN